MESSSLLEISTSVDQFSEKPKRLTLLKLKEIFSSRSLHLLSFEIAYIREDIGKDTRKIFFCLFSALDCIRSAWKICYIKLSNRYDKSSAPIECLIRVSHFPRLHRHQIDQHRIINLISVSRTRDCLYVRSYVPRVIADQQRHPSASDGDRLSVREA
jgi:hypothetical protein